MKDRIGYCDVSAATRGYLQGTGWETRLVELIALLFCAATDAEKEEADRRSRGVGEFDLNGENVL